MSEQSDTGQQSKSPSVWARRRARRALVQAIYQWQLSGHGLVQLKADFESSDALKKADRGYFDELLALVVRDAAALDGAYQGHLDRPIEQLGHVERAILRLAAAEFRDRIDIPYRVVITEYVELAKVFGAQDSFKYINGVLDALAKDLRSVEVQANQRG